MLRKLFLTSILAIKYTYTVYIFLKRIYYLTTISFVFYKSLRFYKRNNGTATPLSRAPGERLSTRQLGLLKASRQVGTPLVLRGQTTPQLLPQATCCLAMAHHRWRSMCVDGFTAVTPECVKNKIFNFLHI